MRDKMKKLSGIFKTIFGYGILTCMIMGALMFIGYVLALIIGGETAAAICTFLYKQVAPVMIYISTCMVLLGLISMYLAGEFALTAKKNK